MIIYLLLVSLVAISYITFQIYFGYLWRNLPSVDYENHPESQERITILVPVRNESTSIADCIKALARQDLSSEQVDVLILDNHSSDDTAAIVKRLNFNNIQLVSLADHLPEQTTFKKEAISFGIKLAKTDWILTTDGDCQVPSSWARVMLAAAIDQQADMIIAPISILSGHTMLTAYQALDVAGLMAATGAGLQSNLLISGNGANLLFRKDVFERLGGFRYNASYRSGDDLFIIQNFYNDSKTKVGYLKSIATTVSTKAEKNWSDFFRQRLRWASKSSALPHLSTKLISTVVFMNSLFLIGHLLLMPFAGIWVAYIFILHFLLKVAADLYLLMGAFSFFKGKIGWSQWIASFLINPLYITYVGLVTIRQPSIYWKDRLI